MSEIAPAVYPIDTMLGGRPGFTAAYLVAAERPALVDTGSQTSTRTVIEGLHAHGIGAEDLEWIVLTHIHLDHCGGTGGIAAAFPNATVVVHRRGARHLTEPDRLVSATAAVHGHLAPLYGGLDPTPAERIVAAEDGHRVDLGGRRLLLAETPGHARHHMAVVDEQTGTIFAGDAVGVTFGEGTTYPAMPPSDIDIPGWLRSLDRIEALDPQVLCPAHFGPVADPGRTIAVTRAQLRTTGEAALAAWRSDPGVESVRAALSRELPLEAIVRAPQALEYWHSVEWELANPDGVAAWARSVVEAEDGAPG